jgi:hypothetical protein
MSLPNWVEEAKVTTVLSDEVIGKRPDIRLVKALEIAWEALGSLNKTVCPTCRRDADAGAVMRRIEELGAPKP